MGNKTYRRIGAIYRQIGYLYLRIANLRDENSRGTGIFVHENLKIIKSCEDQIEAFKQELKEVQNGN